jgi:hypothetical protein
MHFLPHLLLLVIIIVVVLSALYLFKNIKKGNILVNLSGLFLLALGSLLLVLDMTLVAITHGPQHIFDYLVFNRLVSDTGFSGRWVMTSYVFICSGFLIFLYVFAMQLIKRDDSQ